MITSEEMIQKEAWEWSGLTTNYNLDWPETCRNARPN